MTTIDPTSAQAALFEKLGISKQSDTQKASKDTLGQSDFLKLMTTQLQNQDPFALRWIMVTLLLKWLNSLL